MEVYKFVNLDDGDILLQKVYIDDILYDIIDKDDGNKLLQKKVINIGDMKDIKKYDFRNSIILECLINGVIFNRLRYKYILEEIYRLINDGCKIIKCSGLNIKTYKKDDEGFYYLEDIGISVQGVESYKSILEIINQCIQNKIKIFIKIKLVNQTTININF